MINEPDFLTIAPGDSVRFIPAQPDQNAATIDGMTDAEPFKSLINEDFTVMLTEPGLYGIKCSPHYAMRIVILIEVGEITERALPIDRGDFDRLGAGQSEIKVVTAGFRFLLDREPKEAMLRRFDLSVVSRYFPEFERELPGDLDGIERDGRQT